MSPKRRRRGRNGRPHTFRCRAFRRGATGGSFRQENRKELFEGEVSTDTPAENSHVCWSERYDMGKSETRNVIAQRQTFGRLFRRCQTSWRKINGDFFRTWPRDFFRTLFTALKERFSNQKISDREALLKKPPRGTSKNASSSSCPCSPSPP